MVVTCLFERGADHEEGYFYGSFFALPERGLNSLPGELDGL